MTTAATVGLVLSLAGVLPGSRDLLANLVESVPAAGILRDGQKWIAPYALLLAPASALGVARLAARSRDAALANLAAVGAVVALIAVLPDLAWGATGRLRAVDYPDDWYAVRAVLQSDSGHGDVAVLPWGAFRAFDWNSRRTVLDPAQRFLPGSVVTSTDLPVGAVVVEGDDARAAAVRAAFDRPYSTARLQELGIGWVLEEKGQAGEELAEPPGNVRYDGTELRLVQLAAPGERSRGAHATLVAVADGLIALFVLVCVAASVAAKSRRRRLPAGRVRPP